MQSLHLKALLLIKHFVAPDTVFSRKLSSIMLDVYWFGFTLKLVPRLI